MLDISPVVLPITDVLTALQTGLLDVVASSPVVALVMQWHTRVSYITDLPVAYSMGVFAIDARVYDRISAADQAVVRDILSATTLELDRAARDDNAQALEVMHDNGIAPVEVDRSDVDGRNAVIVHDL